MPKPLELVVEAYEDRVPGRQYMMKVVAFRKSKKPLGIIVTLEHLDKDQIGREHAWLLGLPLLPNSAGTRFFRALGFATDVDSRIRPGDSVGRRLLITFGPATDGQDPEPIAFHPIQESEHAEHAG